MNVHAVELHNGTVRRARALLNCAVRVHDTTVECMQSTPPPHPPYKQKKRPKRLCERK